MAAPAPRFTFGLVVALLMIGMGLFVVARLLYTGGRTLTGPLWLDLGFAAFFVLRGTMALSVLRRQMRRDRQEPPVA